MYIYIYIYIHIFVYTTFIYRYVPVDPLAHLAAHLRVHRVVASGAAREILVNVLVTSWHTYLVVCFPRFIRPIFLKLADHYPKVPICTVAF